MQSFLYLKGPFCLDAWAALIWQAFQVERFFEAGIWHTVDHTWVERVLEMCFANWEENNA